MENYYHATRDALKTLKDHLDANALAIRPGLHALYGAIPQARHLVDNVIFMLEDFRNRLRNTDVAGMPGIGEVAQFAGLLDALLVKSGALLPDRIDTLRDARGTAQLMRDLPALAEVKEEILWLLEGIIGHCRDMK